MMALSWETYNECREVAINMRELNKKLENECSQRDIGAIEALKQQENVLSLRRELLREGKKALGKIKIKNINKNSRVSLVAQW